MRDTVKMKIGSTINVHGGRVRASALLTRRIGFMLCAALYVALLQIAYIVTIVPDWSYAGFVFGKPPMLTWLAVTIMAVAPAIWIPVRLSRPSQWLYLYLYMAVFVPSCFVPLFRNLGLGRLSCDTMGLTGVLF